jgi:hypothetical protein
VVLAVQPLGVLAASTSSPFAAFDDAVKKMLTATTAGRCETFGDGFSELAGKRTLQAV